MIVFYLIVAQDALMRKISNKNGSINIKQSRASFFFTSQNVRFLQPAGLSATVLKITKMTVLKLVILCNETY